MNEFYLSQAIPCPGGTIYTIRAGDTLFALAARFNTTVAALTAANPGVDPNNLRVGQTICLPGPAVPGACPGGTLYTVQAGDTFFLIAQRAGITLAILLAANPGVDPNRLRIGQVICVPAPPAQAVVCTIRLRGTEQVTGGPFFPAGIVFTKPAAPGAQNFTVTFTAAGLPEPRTLGNFDDYVGRVTIFPSGEIYTVSLGRVAIEGQPVTWAGSRDVPQAPSNRDLVEVRPLNTATGATGAAVLLGLNLFCEPA